MVAICEGCTGQGGGEVDPPITTSKPLTTASEPSTTTSEPSTTTSEPSAPTSEPLTTTSEGFTTSPNDKCCSSFALSSEGGVLEHYHEALGVYELKEIDANGKPFYEHITNLLRIYLHFTTDQDHNWSGWQFTRDESDVFGFLANENPDTCPTGTVQCSGHH